MDHEKPHPAPSPGPAEEPTPAAFIKIGLVPSNPAESVDIGDVHSVAEPTRGPGEQPGPANSGHPEWPSSAAVLRIKLIPGQWRK